MGDLKKETITIKDMIMILIFVAGVLAGWYSNKTDMTILEKQVNDNTLILKKNNLELINYKLDKILKIVDKL